MITIGLIIGLSYLCISIIFSQLDFSFEPEYGNTRNFEGNPYIIYFIFITVPISLLLFLEFHLHNGYHILRLSNWFKGLKKG